MPISSDRRQPVGDFRKSKDRLSGARKLVVNGIRHLGRHRKRRMIGPMLHDEDGGHFVHPEARGQRHQPQPRDAGGQQNAQKQGNDRSRFTS